MTSENKSLEKKNFHRVENVIKQLVHTSADFYSQGGRVALGYASPMANHSSKKDCFLEWRIAVTAIVMLWLLCLSKKINK